MVNIKQIMFIDFVCECMRWATVINSKMNVRWSTVCVNINQIQSFDEKKSLLVSL